MKTNINLYLDEFKPKPDLLSLKVLSYVWLSCIVLVGFLYGIALWQNQSVGAVHKKLSNDVALERALVNEFKTLALAHKEDQQLANEVELLKKEIAIKRKLVSMLSKTDDVDGKGYSKLMFDLSIYAHRHIWLTDISYNSEHVLITGATTTPASLPTWLSDLSDSDYFAGKSLSDLSIKASEDKRYSLFTVATEKAPSKDPMSAWFDNDVAGK